MEVKYYANSMQDALDKIKRELGPDAVVVSSAQVRSRKGLLGFFSPKVYEVIASYEPKIKRGPTRRMDYKRQETGFVARKPVDSGGYETEKQKVTPVRDKKATPKPSAPGATPAQATAAKRAAPKASPPGAKAAHKNTEKPKLEKVAPDPQPGRPEAAKTPEPKKEKNRSSLDMMVERALKWEKQEKTEEKQQVEHSKIQELDDKLEKLNVILDQFSNTVQDAHVESVGIDLPPELEKLYTNMLECDTDEPVARELMDKARAILKKRPEATEMEVMDHVLREFIGDIGEIVHKKFEQEVIMIIGPTGVGKTTTLVKLASHFVTTLGLKVGIINTDVYRVGAQEQLKTYAEILDVPMITVYNPDDIGEAIESFGDKDMIFVDTAGKVSSDETYQEDVRKLIELAGVDQIYLAVSASTNTRNLKQAFENYSFLREHSLIVTKLDEGNRLGSLLNMRKYSGRPLSYMTIGQSVPDDIQKTDVAAIISEILRY